MKIFNKYLNNTTSDQEQEAITELFIREKFNNELRQKMTQRLQANYGIARDQPGGKSTRLNRLQIIRWGSSIAAAILIGFAVWYVTAPTPSYQQLTNEYLAEHIPSNERRKGAAEISQLRAAAIDAYSKQDYVKSAELRKQVTEYPEARGEDFFYLGLSYLFQEKAQLAPAIEALRSAVEFPTGHYYQEESQWFLSLAYIKAERIEEARALLQSTVDQQLWNANKAQQLLEALPDQK